MTSYPLSRTTHQVFLSALGNDVNSPRPDVEKYSLTEWLSSDDIVVEANADVGDYWIRGGWVDACARNTNAKDMTGIIRYDPSSTSEPTTSSNITAPTTCNDEPQS